MLLFVSIIGFAFAPSAYSEKALEQLSLELWADSSLSGDGAKFKSGDINFTAHRPFNAILEEMGFGKVNILISKQETDYQEKKIKNGMPFKTALKKAFENITVNNNRKDSLYQMALKTAYKNLNIDPQNPVSKAAEKETSKILKTCINRGDSEIKIFGLSKFADRGESAKQNWIFYLHVPKISSKGFFIIIDRKGKNAACNYPAFISYHNSDVSGEIKDAPEIPKENDLNSGVIDEVDEDSEFVEAADGSCITDIRKLGRILYNNYGAQFTMVRFEGWPGKLPIYGEFAVPYRNYLANARKIDKMRIDTRDCWIRLNENISDEKAKNILRDMKKMGREYDRLIGEVLGYVRQGQQLYAEGRATFPSLLYNVKLVKGAQLIQLYDDNGKKIQNKTCIHWKYNHWNFFPFGGLYTFATNNVYVCDKWKITDAKAKVPDYSLEYGYKGDQVYPHRARMMDVPPTPAFPEVFLQESLRRNQYDMEVVITCTLDKDPDKGWLISEAKMRKGKNTSSDALGGSVGVSGTVGVPLIPTEVGISVNVNYNHTWNHFRFGEMVFFNGFIGKPCFELSREKYRAFHHE